MHLVQEASGTHALISLAALQALPSSGLLHSYSVWLEPRPTRKTRSVDALKKTNNAPSVIVTVARLFWAERKIEKARDWFSRAVAADPDYGDAWAWWWKFEKQHGTEVGLSDPALFSAASTKLCVFFSQEHRVALKDKCIAADPRHGQIWPTILKDPESVGKDVPALLDLASEALEDAP